MDSLSMIHGSSMDYPRVVHGSSVDYPWIIHGLYMDHPWIIHGLSMDYPWIIHGLSMEFPWETKSKVDQKWFSKVMWFIGFWHFHAKRKSSKVGGYVVQKWSKVTPGKPSNHIHKDGWLNATAAMCFSAHASTAPTGYLLRKLPPKHTKITGQKNHVGQWKWCHREPN